MFGIFDIALDSDIDLPELPTLPPGKARYLVRVQLSREKIPSDPAISFWQHHWQDRQGGISASSMVVAGGFLVAVPEVADFFVMPDTRTIRVHPSSGVPPATLRHALLDQIIPMYLGQLGRQVLHASAVELPDGQVVAFVGDSGLGKSTLAAAFAVRGAKVLTDDCLLIDEQDGNLVARGNYPGIRLLDDSAQHYFGAGGIPGSVSHQSAKTRLPVGTGVAFNDHCPGGRLSALFLLAEPSGAETFKLRPLSEAADLLPIIKQHFYIDIHDKELLKVRFASIRRLFEAEVALFSLDYPRHFHILDELCEQLHQHLSSQDIAGCHPMT